MRKILKSIHSTPSYKKLLIPKNPDIKNEEWVEIKIDYTNQIFIAQKVKIVRFSEEWVDYKDYAFPSSLLNEFLNE